MLALPSLETDRAPKARLLVALVTSLVLVACAGGPPPVFEPSLDVEGGVLVMEPRLRLGTDGAAIGEVIAEPLERNVRQALAGRGLSVVDPADESGLETFRRAVDLAWSRQRASSSRRFRAGQDLGLVDVLGAPARSGAKSAAFVVLARTGSVGEGEYVPIPPDELILLPEERPDYVVPKAGTQAAAGGTDLDLVLIDLRSGAVVLHRRVSHPATNVGDIIDAIPVLVREVTRGLR